MARVHPLTGEPLNGHAHNGHPRPELMAYFAGSKPTRRAKLSIDAARSGTDLDGHWAFADALDADGAYSQGVRHKLIQRSRYESANNAFYAGILKTYTDLVIGNGPTLRMLTKNRNFNQLVEREFFRWANEVKLASKLWTMCHAKVQDGETFGILQTNPELRNGVQLDFQVIEAEQCQSVNIGLQAGQIDGIIYDELNNIVAYDILPYHPGTTTTASWADPVRVEASQVLHWFKCQRPGQHRGIPELTSSLNVGASSRRFREATVAAAETAADIGAMLTSNLGPAGDSEPDPVAPFSTVEFVKRMLMVAPMGWDAKQMKAEHPNAQYAEFHRLQISEQARPLAMPFNAAAGDSSTYSFASGKLDMLLFWRGADVDRRDCDNAILDRLFDAWFREWTVVPDSEIRRREISPSHQWDWPVHPVIDAVSEATATDTRLKNGTITLRQVYSDQGKDLEDELSVMAEDTFGEATEENIAKMRKIVVLNNTSRFAIDHVAQILGLKPAETKAPEEQKADEQAI
jgi:capsid protein